MDAKQAVLPDRFLAYEAAVAGSASRTAVYRFYALTAVVNQVRCFAFRGTSLPSASRVVTKYVTALLYIYIYFFFP